MNIDNFNRDKKRYDKDNKVAILGGVHPKYYVPIQGSDLIQDLQNGMNLADAIVVTGQGTGMETPLEKIQEFKKIVKDFPLIVGAGMNVDNIKTHLSIADGAIVGSTFKPNGDVDKPVEMKRVREFMKVVNELRVTI